MLKVEDILKRLKELRKKKALKQDYIAKRLGIDRTTYVRKERGLIPITTREWLVLADVMSEDPSYFFFPFPSRRRKGGQREAKLLAKLYNCMSHEERRDLMQILVLASRILANEKVRKGLLGLDATV